MKYTQKEIKAHLEATQKVRIQWKVTQKDRRIESLAGASKQNAKPLYETLLKSELAH
jgi:hypothetical protein